MPLNQLDLALGSHRARLYQGMVFGGSCMRSSAVFSCYHAILQPSAEVVVLCRLATSLQEWFPTLLACAQLHSSNESRDGRGERGGEEQ